MSDDPRVAENKGKINLRGPLDKISKEDILYPVKPKKQTLPAKVTFTPSLEDYAILTEGKKKHGVPITSVLRMALRRFAEAEGLNRKAS